MSERHEGGHQALFSCLSKITCFHKEDTAAVLAPSKSSREDSRNPSAQITREASKREQTKQWLQDLSTVAEYDVTTTRYDVTENQYDDVLMSKARPNGNGSGGNRVAYVEVVPHQRPERFPLNGRAAPLPSSLSLASTSSSDSDTQSPLAGNLRPFPARGGRGGAGSLVSTTTSADSSEFFDPPTNPDQQFHSVSISKAALPARQRLLSTGKRRSLPPSGLIINHVAQQDNLFQGVEPLPAVSGGDRRRSLPQNPPGGPCPVSTMLLANNRDRAGSASSGIQQQRDSKRRSESGCGLIQEDSTHRIPRSESRPMDDSKTNGQFRDDSADMARHERYREVIGAGFDERDSQRRVKDNQSEAYVAEKSTNGRRSLPQQEMGLSSGFRKVAPFPCPDASQDPHARAASVASLHSATTASQFTTSPLEAVLVVVDLRETRHLGITVVGQSSEEGDLGIFVGSLKRGGAAERNGGVMEGDWILEVNGLDLGLISNDAALEVLRREIASGGDVITLLLAKYVPEDAGSSCLDDIARGREGRTKPGRKKTEKETSRRRVGSNGNVKSAERLESTQKERDRARDVENKMANENWRFSERERVRERESVFLEGQHNTSLATTTESMISSTPCPHLQPSSRRRSGSFKKKSQQISASQGVPGRASGGRQFPESSADFRMLPEGSGASTEDDVIVERNLSGNRRISLRMSGGLAYTEMNGGINSGVHGGVHDEMHRAMYSQVNSRMYSKIQNRMNSRMQRGIYDDMSSEFNDGMMAPLGCYQQHHLQYQSDPMSELLYSSRHGSFSDLPHHDFAQYDAGTFREIAHQFPSIESRHAGFREAMYHQHTGGKSGFMNADRRDGCFKGGELVDWIQMSVDGLAGRMDAVGYASGLLMDGYIVDAQGAGGAEFSEMGTYRVGKSWDRNRSLAVL